MRSASADTRGLSAHGFGGGQFDYNDKVASDALHVSGVPIMTVKQSGLSYGRPEKSRQGDAISSSMPTTSLFARSNVNESERTPEPLVSIQLADDDGEDSNTPAKSRGAKGNFYRRVWGSGPSPVLQRQFQRYSLRGKLNKSIGGRDSVVESPANRDPPPAAGFRPSHDTQPSDQSLRESAPAGALAFTPVHHRTVRNGSSNSRSVVGGSMVHMASELTNSSCSKAPAAASRTPEPRASASPAACADARTPEPRACASPVLPATASRTPAGRAAAVSPVASASRTPEARIPRVAYLTPTAKGTTPGSALAYRTTASSPGPNPLTPPSAIRPSPNLGSGRKPVQHQPRGLAVLRHRPSVGATVGSAAWPGVSPARSEVVATPEPAMARTLDGLLMIEALMEELVGRAVEVAESGARPSAALAASRDRDSVAATPVPTRRLLKLAVVSEVDRADADAASEGGSEEDGGPPGCRCVVM